MPRCHPDRHIDVANLVGEHVKVRASRNLMRVFWVSEQRNEDQRR
jgi:hypothetical protein